MSIELFVFWTLHPKRRKEDLTLQSDAVLMKHRDQHFDHWYIDRWL